MKKVLTSFLVAFGLFIGLSSASANAYVLDNASVDNLFTTSVEVGLDAISLESANSMNLAGMSSLSASDKNAFVAAVLAWFLGGFAVHRYYLGTKSTMFFYYFCTCGGIFGIIPIIDTVMLLINNKDISAYCNNEKFIMF